MLNPVQKLKLQIMTDGIIISDTARRKLMGSQEDRPLTLSDYVSTSGVSIRIGEDVWVNAPIAEYNSNFVDQPESILEFQEGQFTILSGNMEIQALPMPIPDYHIHYNQWGEPYTQYCYTHTDRVRISPIEGCAFACRFCDMSYSHPYRIKRVEGLLDSIRVALSDKALPAKHILISGGTPHKSDYEYINDVYTNVLNKFPNISVDIMMTPMEELLDIERLDHLGIHQLCLNIEIYNESLARHYMPNKAGIGRDAYLNFIERAVERLGPGRVRSLILVGLEPIEDTLAGVTALADRGCEPVLSPFRPSPKTPLSHLSPPTMETLCLIYERSIEVVEKRGIKLGPRCIPCMHNTLTFPDGSDYYFSY